MKKFVGAKRGAGVLQWLVNQMPPHRFFIETFLGTGHVTQHKKPAAFSIGIDSDATAPGLDALRLFPECLAIVGDARDVLPDVVATLISSDAAGVIAKYGVKISPPQLTMRDLIVKSGEGGHAIAHRQKQRVRPEILVYADPPYLRSARRKKDRPYYQCELLEDHEHTQLLRLLKSLPCNVMISGYESELYAQELAGWRVATFNTITRGGPAVEMLWCNFEEPKQLHDTRFVGDDFRERERIKRKVTRWKKRLESMPAQERQALQEAMAAIK